MITDSDKVEAMRALLLILSTAAMLFSAWGAQSIAKMRRDNNIKKRAKTKKTRERRRRSTDVQMNRRVEDGKSGATSEETKGDTE